MAFVEVEQGNRARADRVSPATHDGQTLHAPAQRMLAAEAAELDDEMGRLVAVVAP